MPSESGKANNRGQTTFFKVNESRSRFWVSVNGIRVTIHKFVVLRAPRIPFAERSGSGPAVSFMLMQDLTPDYFLISG